MLHINIVIFFYKKNITMYLHSKMYTIIILYYLLLIPTPLEKSKHATVFAGPDLFTISIVQVYWQFH